MRLSAHTAQAGRGITWLNAVNDQVTGIGQVVAPGTPRDHLHSLGALLNPDDGRRPEMVTTNNASAQGRRRRVPGHPGSAVGVGRVHPATPCSSPAPAVLTALPLRSGAYRALRRRAP
ncbi:hypothetical protein CG740_19465 [Streptomyces sp. CB01201]|nr:hypothetical protein CG740_19465 [Streptomyces sp. CB01201]